ncbi:SRPBCC family protein [Micromonospora sp. B11E3]|uniref:aromatase/cyclase n=1 Tax=Micromonospora sp. B11E3 TaxID=3153562 RepID=UPI00325DE3B9
MSLVTSQSVHRALVNAPQDVVFDLIADMKEQRRIFQSVIHTAQLGRDDTGDRVERWSWIRPLDAVRSWRARRELDRSAGRITFAHENPPAPLTAVSGEWQFTAQPAGATLVELRHEYAFDDGAPDGKETVELLDRGSAAQLNQLSDFVDAKADIDELQVSYESELLINEPIEDVYTYFSDASRWNERIPHCLGATLKEETPNLQVVTMDVQVPSGAVHTTKQARVCFPNEKIIWRQLEGLPPLDDALYGYMLFTQTAEGVLVRTGQTELLKRNGVAKRGWTVAEAKHHVAEVRGGRNLDSLKSAQEYLSRRRA